MTTDYLLISLILISGLYMAWSIGANDVANAMGTSVGSGALRLKQAIVIAAVLEFCGAFFFGSHVSETIQSGILNPDYFVAQPKVLVLGMLASLIGTGVWLQIASYWGWPVSATHTIVGSLVGFGLLIGPETIYWGEIGSIVLSWIISPFLGGLLGFAIFTLLRKKILYRDQPVKAAQKLVPRLTFLVITTLSLVILFHGIQTKFLDLSFSKVSYISLTLGLCAFFISKVYVKLAARSLKASTHPPATTPEVAMRLERAKKHLLHAKTISKGELHYQITALLKELDTTKNTVMHPEEFERTSEEFSVIEKMFGWLQIISACLMAFSHGSNDVANAIGPLSASIAILNTGLIGVKSEVPSWALALGGFGIVLGLATWGWRVIETIGKKITELTPTRGFAAEFGAAFTILVASRIGLPISTTHTLVGAVIGVGLARGIEALNLGMMREIIGSWIITMPAGALMSISVYTVLSWFFL